jgi:hypothetical protein
MVYITKEEHVDELSRQDRDILALVRASPGMAAWDVAIGLREHGWKGNRLGTSRRLKHLTKLGYLGRAPGPRYEGTHGGRRPFRYYATPKGAPTP